MARRSARRPLPKLSHEAVRTHLMDYHFGRLSPELNAAVERHVRSCPTCQREGMEHLATQKREGVRLTRRSIRAHSRQRRATRLLELVLSLSLVPLLVFLVAYGVVGKGLPLFGALVKSHLPAPTATIAPTPTPTQLTPKVTFAAASAGSVAVALSPNGKSVALATVQNGTPSIAIWDAAAGKQVQAMPFTDTAAPGVLAWSPNGKLLAAANGATIMAWDVASGTLLWSIILPQGSALRVYDVQGGGVAQRPDPAATFAQGPFAQWAANGNIAPASATAAGASGVAMPNGPIIGLWQVAGSHIFANGSQPHVGVSTADAAARVALLTWSPDNRYLLWGVVALPVAVSPTAGQSATPPPSAVQPPNGLAQTLAGHVAAAPHSDALLWVAPNGAWVAYCDRTAQNAPLAIAAPDQSSTLAEIPGACAGLTVDAFAWRADSSGFVLARPAHPVTTYSLPSAHS